MGFVDLVLSCHRAFVVFREYFVGSKYYLVGITWVHNFSSWVLRGSKMFPVGISWFQIFFSLVFGGSKIFSGGFNIFSRG